MATGIVIRVGIFFDLDVELVLLIAARVRVAHEVNRVRVETGCWSDELQLDFGFLLQRNSFDGDERVVVRIADNHPPALLAFLREEGRNDGTSHVVLALQIDVDADCLAGDDLFFVEDLE